MDTQTFVALCAVSDYLVSQLATGSFVSDHIFACGQLGNLNAKIDSACGQVIESLSDDLDTLEVFENTDNNSGEYVTGVVNSLLEIEIVIAGVRSVLTNVNRNVRCSCVRTDSANADSVFSGENANALGSESYGLVCKKDVSESEHRLFDLIEHLEYVVLLLGSDVSSCAAGDYHTVVNTVAGELFKDIHDSFTVVPGVHEKAVVADKVAGNA